MWFHIHWRFESIRPHHWKVSLEEEINTEICLQDLGDYYESYYSVQTTEGEAIAQLIAGYINIIMQRKKPKLENEDEDEPAIVEMNVNPKQ